MDLIIPQPAAVSIDLAAWHHRDRIARIGALVPEDATVGVHRRPDGPRPKRRR